MLILFLISFHVMLMIIYMIAVEFGISRHSYIHILFAFCLPFVGELCLFVSEFVRSEKSFNRESLFGSDSGISDSGKKTVMNVKMPVSRSSLLEVIEKKPLNEIDILHEALDSQDAEVVHIAAATIMKYQRDHENRIAEISCRYESFPDDMAALGLYIDTLGEYYTSGLLSGESAAELLRNQKKLIEHLLSVIPDSPMGITALIKNTAFSGDISGALTLCHNSVRRFRNYSIWKEAFILINRYGSCEEVSELCTECEKICGCWNAEERREWHMLKRCRT